MTPCLVHQDHRDDEQRSVEREAEALWRFHRLPMSSRVKQRSELESARRLNGVSPAASLNLARFVESAVS